MSKYMIKKWPKFIEYVHTENHRRALSDIEINKNTRDAMEKMGAKAGQAIPMTPFRSTPLEPTFENFMNWLSQQDTRSTQTPTKGDQEIATPHQPQRGGNR